MRTISVIIPAYNDAQDLQKTLLRLREIREREYPALEIIVSVRPSTDDTDAVARALADRVVEGGTPSVGRNAGAEIAQGEIFVFLDADAVPNFGTFPEIANTVAERIIGTCASYPNLSTPRARFAIWFKNTMHRIGIWKSASSLLFCHRRLFIDRGIRYDPKRSVGEPSDLVWRARKRAGARYVFLPIPRGYEFSVDRYERNGYLKTFLFWVRWWIATHIFRVPYERFERVYWSS